MGVVIIAEIEVAMPEYSIEESLIRARYALERHDWRGVWVNSQLILESDPDHAEATSLSAAALTAFDTRITGSWVERIRENMAMAVGVVAILIVLLLFVAVAIEITG